MKQVSVLACTLVLSLGVAWAGVPKNHFSKMKKKHSLERRLECAGEIGEITYYAKARTTGDCHDKLREIHRDIKIIY